MGTIRNYYTLIKKRAGFIRDLRYYYRPIHPTHLSWAITSCCNSDCLYCEARQLETGHDLSPKRALKLVDEMASFGIKNVHLTGGEPFLNKNIWNILEKCYVHGIGISIPTNSSLVSSFGTKELTILRKTVKKMDVSLDSLQKEMNDHLRGKKGAYEDAIKALGIFKKEGVGRLAINMAVTRLNYKEIPVMLRFAKEVGVNYVNFQLVGQTSIFADTPAKDKRYLLIQDEKELQELEHVIEGGLRVARSERIPSSLSTMRNFALPYFQSFMSSDGEMYLQKFVRNFKCIRVAWATFIDYNGKLKPCAVLPPIGDITNSSLKDEWKKQQRLVDNMKKGHFPKDCRYCFCNLSENVIFSAITSPVVNRGILYRIAMKGY